MQHDECQPFKHHSSSTDFCGAVKQAENAQFEEAIRQRIKTQDIKSNTYESLTESSFISEQLSESSSGKGELIYMNFYLGDVLGYQELRGLTTDDPDILARHFFHTHKITALKVKKQIKEMICKKIEDVKSYKNSKH